MRRLPLLAAAALALAAPARAADAFDYYTNPVLARALEARDNIREVKELTPGLVAEHDRALPNASAAFLIVRTNEGRLAKLLVQAARQRAGDDRAVPMLLVDRYVTYKEGEEQTVQAHGRNLALFPGFRLNLDIGQVVPEELGGDLRFVKDGDKVYAQPLGKARLYLLTKGLPDVPPKKGPKLVVGEKFEPRYFNGKYKVHDDGRRSGTLVLKVDDGGSVSGAYYSDKDGQKYEVSGRLGMPPYSIQFTVKFPRSEQTFQGWMFTGDGAAIAGTSRLAEREAGFYATRAED